MIRFWIFTILKAWIEPTKHSRNQLLTMKTWHDFAIYLTEPGISF